MTAHASGRFRIVEVEGVRNGRRHMLLLLHFFQVLLESLLKALEIRYRLSLGWHKCEYVLVEITLLLIATECAASLLLNLLFHLMLLHPWWKL